LKSKQTEAQAVVDILHAIWVEVLVKVFHRTDRQACQHNRHKTTAFVIRAEVPVMLLKRLFTLLRRGITDAVRQQRRRRQSAIVHRGAQHPQAPSQNRTVLARLIRHLRRQLIHASGIMPRHFMHIA
ncbi:hypothetical protein TcCL_Unassigned03234, partial [Trypanosoma cruzi]